MELHFVRKTLGGELGYVAGFLGQKGELNCAKPSQVCGMCYPSPPAPRDALHD